MHTHTGGLFLKEANVDQPGDQQVGSYQFGHHSGTMMPNRSMLFSNVNSAGESTHLDTYEVFESEDTFTGSSAEYDQGFRKCSGVAKYTVKKCSTLNNSTQTKCGCSGPLVTFSVQSKLADNAMYDFQGKGDQKDCKMKYNDRVRNAAEKGRIAFLKAVNDIIDLCNL